MPDQKTLTNFIMKIFLILFVIAALTFIACKKETKKPSFSPVGYWKGNAYIVHVAILNRPNGTSRFYYQIPGDTANSVMKLDGTYSVAEDMFKSSYEDNGVIYSFEAYDLSKDVISGLYITSQGVAAPFELKRQ
jgi:hypothetical protein